MRTHGTLIKWNDDRGFGFISAAQGSSELFVHISAFPRDGERPRLNELVSYEAETTHDGKLRAVRIMRAGGKHPPHPRQIHESTGRFGRAIGTTLEILAVLALGVFVYSRAQAPDEKLQSAPPIPSFAVPKSSSFECDGRIWCSEMTSCAEARNFQEHCPGTKMDGDGDGEPCEQQWCN